MRVFTIGFTKKTAEKFFSMLRNAGVRTIVDVRLNNVSQLAGFSKRDDLEYFARNLCNADYIQLPELAPTKEILDAYKKRKGDWETYERQFLDLMDRRRIAESVPKQLMDGACLLCSEDKPHHCHRRLVAEYLAKKWQDVEIEHLV